MDIIEMAEAPPTEEQEEEEHQRRLFATLTDLVTKQMSLTLQAGATPHTIGTSLARVLANYMHREIKEGHERAWLEEWFTEDVLLYVEKDRSEGKKGLN